MGRWDPLPDRCLLWSEGDLYHRRWETQRDLHKARLKRKELKDRLKSLETRITNGETDLETIEAEIKSRKAADG